MVSWERDRGIVSQEGERNGEGLGERDKNDCIRHEHNNA